jgi:hypothetical protein
MIMMFVNQILALSIVASSIIETVAWSTVPHVQPSRFPHVSLLELSSQENQNDEAPIEEEDLAVPVVVVPTPVLEERRISSGEIMRAMGTSPRRIFLSGLSASGIALVGNFLGVTSKLLTFVPESTVEASGLDTYFPRGTHSVEVMSAFISWRSFSLLLLFYRQL